MDGEVYDEMPCIVYSVREKAEATCPSPTEIPNVNANPVPFYTGNRFPVCYSWNV